MFTVMILLSFWITHCVLRWHCKFVTYQILYLSPMFKFHYGCNYLFIILSAICLLIITFFLWNKHTILNINLHPLNNAMRDTSIWSTFFHFLFVVLSIIMYISFLLFRLKSALSYFLLSTNLWVFILNCTVQYLLEEGRV